MDQFYNYHGNSNWETKKILVKEKFASPYESYYEFKNAKGRNVKKIQLCSELRALADQDLVGGKN